MPLVSGVSGTASGTVPSPDALLSNGSLNGAVQQWHNNGDGTYTLTLSPLAWDFLADNDFVAVAAGAIIFVPGVGEVVIAVGGAVVIYAGVYALYDYWLTHKDDAPPGVPRPKTTPPGTKPINEFKNPKLTHDQIEQIKEGVHQGPNDWTGIAPNGDVITGDLQGNAQDHGSWRTFTH